jgi:hypothetical protein
MVVPGIQHWSNMRLSFNLGSNWERTSVSRLQIRYFAPRERSLTRARLLSTVPQHASDEAPDNNLSHGSLVDSCVNGLLRPHLTAPS